MTLHSEPFGTLSDGRVATLYHLSRDDGLDVRVTDYGATLVSILAPDRSGARADVVLGYDSLEAYERQTFYCGGLVGRFANRIAGGRFTLDGRPYHLSINNGANHLHGGVAGFDRRLWQATSATSETVTLEYRSAAGEEGYPGNLTAAVTFSLVEPRTLRLELRARTGSPTIVNLTSHTYFNLGGRGTILDHELMIPADAYTPVDAVLIPTGELAPVEGTPFDFRAPGKIGARLSDDHPQLRYGQGYDHNFVIKRGHSTDLLLAARLCEPESGRVVEVYSTQPGIQFYSGNYLGGGERARDGSLIPQNGALALEPHNFPDAPNHPHFPPAVLRAGEEYVQAIEYRFGLRPE